MNRDIIKQTILNVLNDLFKNHEICSIEKLRIANIFSNLLMLDFDMRYFFYKEVSKIDQEISKKLEILKNELLDELIDKKKTSIIN